MGRSKIEWTQETWNPITGCSHFSDGCKNCYAEKMAKRLQKMGIERYRNGFNVTIHEDLFGYPLGIKKPKLIFVCSMGDFFHGSLVYRHLEPLMDVMRQAKQHQFLILTKRAGAFEDLYEFEFPENVGVGVTVESNDYFHRIRLLRNKCNAAFKFISFEPLLSGFEIGVDLSGIDWVIVGGESGPGARPMKKEWVLQIKGEAERQGVPFFFKQWGGVNKKKTGRELDGVVYNGVPERLKRFFKGEV